MGKNVFSTQKNNSKSAASKSIMDSEKTELNNLSNLWNCLSVFVCFFVYQELRGAQHVESERLNSWVMYSELPMDSWTLDTGEDAQVSGEPGGI